ncbi:MAG: hypothetical protein ACRC1Z_11225, partial [Waterburya sp.]
MLRITEIKLPLDHPKDALKTAILLKLRIPDLELISYAIFKRSYDARQKGEIRLVYIVDVETTKDKQLLKQFQKDP